MLITGVFRFSLGAAAVLLLLVTAAALPGALAVPVGSIRSGHPAHDRVIAAVATALLQERSTAPWEVESSAGDVKYAACGEEAAAVESGPVEREMRAQYPIVFDAGDQGVIGIEDMVLQTLGAVVQYEHARHRSSISIQGHDGMFTPAPARTACLPGVKRAPVIVTIHGVHIKPKAGGMSFDFPKIDIRFDLAVVAEGTYNERESRSRHRLLFDMLDRDLPAAGNQISVCIDNWKHEISTSSAFDSLVLFLVDNVMGLVEQKIIAAIGQNLKCQLRGKQPAFFTLVHEAESEKQNMLNELKEECGLLRGDPDYPCLNRAVFRVNGEALPSGTDEEKAALRAAAEGVVRGLAASKPHFDLRFSVKYTRLEGADLSALVGLETPTNMIVNFALDSGLDMFESLDAAAGRGEVQADYLKRVFKKWLDDKAVDAATLAALIKSIRKNALHRDTKLNVVLDKAALVVVESETEPGAMTVLARATEGWVRAVAGSGSTFPRNLMLQNKIAKKNRDYIVLLCSQKFEGAGARINACIKEGTLANAQHVAVKPRDANRLYSEDPSRFSGTAQGRIRNFEFSGPLDSTFWGNAAKAACDVDDMECQDAIGNTGLFVTMRRPYFRAGTVKDGVDINKTKFGCNLGIDYKGEFNLGEVVAVMVNAAAYYQQVAAGTVAGDWRNLGKFSDGAPAERASAWRHADYAPARQTFLPSVAEAEARRQDAANRDNAAWKRAQQWRLLGAKAVSGNSDINNACNDACLKANHLCCDNQCYTRAHSEERNKVVFRCGDETMDGCFDNLVKIASFGIKNGCDTPERRRGKAPEVTRTQDKRSGKVY